MVHILCDGALVLDPRSSMAVHVHFRDTYWPTSRIPKTSRRDMVGLWNDFQSVAKALTAPVCVSAPDSRASSHVNDAGGGGTVLGSARNVGNVDYPPPCGDRCFWQWSGEMKEKAFALLHPSFSMEICGTGSGVSDDDSSAGCLAHFPAHVFWVRVCATSRNGRCAWLQRRCL